MSDSNRYRTSARQQAEEERALERAFDSPVPEGINTGEATTQAIAEFIVPLLLDVETRLSNRELARQVERHFDVSFTQRDVEEIFRSQEFQNIWPLNSVGHNPRIDVAKQRFADLLLEAIDVAAELLRNATTPATVRARIFEKILEMNSVKASEPPRSNTAELVEFLNGLGVQNATQINIGTLIQGVQTDDLRAVDEMLRNPTADSNLIGVRRGDQDDDSETDRITEFIEGDFDE